MIDFAERVRLELERARRKFPGLQSSRHEGIAVLMEEMDEAKWAVWTNQPKESLLSELIQVAAMAQRMAEDLRLLPETR